MSGPATTSLRLRTAAAMALWLLAAPVVRADDVPAYLGSDACTSCHADQNAAWQTSDHARAWTLPDETTVLGDFGDVDFEHAGVTTRFSRDGADYVIETTGADGQRRRHKVIGVAGVDPLQQYLLSPEPGRTQVFDIGWDVHAGRWYPVFPDQPAPPGDGFHWTGPYKSWEARCAECHATGYSRNYDTASRSYAPELSQIGVTCEACHGPGSAHVAWSRDPGTAVSVPGLTALGLTVDLGASQQAEVQQCLTCHSRREAFGDGNPLPGTAYADAFAISLLREGLYHPDGTILDEVFEGGSFLQSKMHTKGVRCSDCHDPHSASLKADGNAVCAQCHSPAGNPAFPSLPLRVFDGPEHHFHAKDSAGSRCVACHMPARTYMGVDQRRDHGFRIPRPDLAAAGVPDACTDCHKDKTADWAAQELVTRFPDSPLRGAHFATTFAAARADPTSQAAALLDLAEWQGTAIVRASALALLAPVADGQSADRVAALLADPEPLVRAAAAGALAGLDPATRLERLQGALADPVRAVRIAAARALLDARPTAGSPEAASLAAAMAEWQGALAKQADFPETHLQLGGIGLTLRDWRLAETAFREAVSLDPQLDHAWAMIVRILDATGDPEAARAALAKGRAANPDSQMLAELAAELGVAP